MKSFRLYVQQNRDELWKKKFPILNTILICIGIIFNIYHNGGFCVFVPWAMAIQIICFINIVTFIWFESTRFWQLNALVCGISTGMFFYWIVFIGRAVVFFAAPIWFIFILLWRNVAHPIRKYVRAWYFARITLCVILAVVSTLLFSSAAQKVQMGEYDTKNPMTERILGMHFRYHTRICPYDEWRPPLHDPAMIIGMRLTGDKDPLEGMPLKSRVMLYRKVYPSRPVKARCACSIQSMQNGYFDDELWEEVD